MNERFSLNARLASFRHAFRGLGSLLRDEHNARIHLAATLAVLVLGLVAGVSRLEWALLLLAIALVWVAEALNSAVEHIADAVHPERHPLIGRAKDVAAAGVLVAAALAAAIGLLVFLPYLGGMLNG